MKRKLLNELLVETINDIKSVEALDELDFFDHATLDVVCEHDDTFVASDNASSIIELCCENNGNLDIEFPISTILDFLTSEDGELQIKKAKKS
jgi:hypothetical protein